MKKIFLNKISIILVAALSVVIITSIFVFNHSGNKTADNSNSNSKKCHIIFDSNGGTKVDNLVFDCGTKVDPPKTVPTKNGFEFNGWTYLGVLYDFDQIINDDVELIADYSPLDGVKIVTVSFDTDGVAKIKSIDVKVGETINKPKDPVKYGYKFTGWFLNKDLFDFSQAINNNIQLKAKWKKDTSKKELSDTILVNINNKCTANYSKNVETKEAYIGSTFNIDYLYSTNVAYSTDFCSVVYKTSDKSVASISSSGDVVTLKPGKVELYECINDTDSNTEIGCFKALLVVKDKEHNFQNIQSSESSQTSENTSTPTGNSNPNKISLSTHNIEIDIGQEKEFTISYEPSNIDESAISCFSNNDNAKLNSYIVGSNKRTIVGMKEGTSIITCYNDNNGTANRVKDTINVLVRYHKVQGITFNNVGDFYETSIGFGVCPQYTITPNNATNKNVTLTSSNPSVVAINGECIRTLSEGTSTITITTEEGHFTDSFVVNVHYVSPTDMHIYGCPLNAKVGENIKLTHRISPSHVTDSSVTWTSLNENIATVDQKGNVVIVGRPTATATAHIRVISNANENVTATCSIGIYE